MWRVLNGLHHSITTLSYLWAEQNLHLTGAFGLLKQKLRRTKFECLKDIVDTVNNLANVNFAREVGSQMGEVIVPTYNCQVSSLAI